MPHSTQIYGLDTSVFVRLLTGHPKADFECTANALASLFDHEPTAEIVVSNQVIGEAYITLQHHYNLSKTEARKGIRKLFEDGLVSPLNGSAVLTLLSKEDGAGWMDRLIVQDYQANGVSTLSNDKKCPESQACYD